MKRIRVIHRLRVAMALLGFMALVAAGVGLWWANHTGLPDSWRTAIEEALARQGLHADVASLRYHPLRGVEASEVTVYADATRRRTVARLHELVFDVDRSRLSRGDLRIERLELAGARVTLAVDPDDPESKTLELTEAAGRIQISDGRQLEIGGASGMIGGVRLELDVKFLIPPPDPTHTAEDEELARAQRRRVLTTVIETLDDWGPRSEAPPVMKIRAEVDLADFSTLRSTIRVAGRNLLSRDLEMRSVSLDAELRGPLLVVGQVEIDSPGGRLRGRAEYDFDRRAGRFEMQSSLDLDPILADLRLPRPAWLPSFSSPPEIEAGGEFSQQDEVWSFQTIGRLELEGPRWGRLSADRFSSAFSWDGRRLYLEDLEIEDGARSLTGRVFVTPERIRYQARSSLRPEFWQRSVSIQPLATILADFSAQPGTEVAMDFKGAATPGDPHDWRFAGTAEATELSYRGVPAKRAKVTMKLDQSALEFSDGEVVFDYSDYPLRDAHGGPESGWLKVGMIRHDREASLIEIEGVSGRVWPAPVVRTFAAGVADHLESYGFHRPPALTAEGTIGLHEALDKQDLRLSFESDAAADYEFLGSRLLIEDPSGTVRVMPAGVRVRELEFGLAGGRLRGRIDRRQDEVAGEIDWTGVSLPALGRAYGFEKPPKGRATGRLEFSLTGGTVAGLDGTGHVALENGELFDVPMFGPLSPVVSGVLGRRQAGFQEAKDAFFTFAIEDGVIRSNDFLTTTKSLVFTGDGMADLTGQTMEMTVRMNARGLLGVITLPLKPFYGLFQFRGSGAIRGPEWENVMFTSPPDDQQRALLDPPRALAVPEPATDPPKARVIAPTDPR